MPSIAGLTAEHIAASQTMQVPPAGATVRVHDVDQRCLERAARGLLQKLARLPARQTLQRQVLARPLPADLRQTLRQRVSELKSGPAAAHHDQSTPGQPRHVAEQLILDRIRPVLMRYL